MSHPENSKEQNPHRKLVRKLVLLAVGMFGFGFALWPLYNVFCDLTGLGGRGVQVVQNVGEIVQSDRQIKIRFDATTNSGLPWIFEAKEKSAMIFLGKMSEALYLASNPTDEAIVGQATYNVTPPEASLYFVKTECFCFTQQLLQANETREMPVYYFVQANLPEYIKEITLSYTFFRSLNADAVALNSGETSSASTVMTSTEE